MLRRFDRLSFLLLDGRGLETEHARDLVEEGGGHGRGRQREEQGAGETE
jgi:hypothetical protein